MAHSGKKNPFLSGFLVGLFVGLALSVTVAVLVTSSNPFTGGDSGHDAGSASPATSSAPPAEAPKFEFYKSLPEGRPSAMPAATPAGPIYFLQAGAFGNPADADQAKAHLALLGFEADVLSSQEGETMMHKVRIGPYKSLDELNTARARLTQSGVETILVKIAPEQQEKQ